MSKPDDDLTYLPDIYQRFRAENSDVVAAYALLAATADRGGPLAPRDQRLVKLGIAIGLRAEGAVRSHVRRGLADGLTAAELRHAAVLGITTAGLPATVAAYKWTAEVTDAETRTEPSA
jgi:4-carboxymuconolactone decarboxylase